MSEMFHNQIVLKMRQATTNSRTHLCASCSSAVVRRGVNSSEDLQVCTYIGGYTHGKHAVITGQVAECSSYYPKNLPSIHQLQEIAWEIVTKGDRGKVGFITPEDRRKAGIGFGYPAVAAPPPCG